MPATKEVAINLFGSEQQDHTPIGHLITWVTTYGRYILITTEMIVLIAFISRFSLDRQLTDLRDEILQKQEIIEANKDLETSFRQTQDALAKIKALLDKQTVPTQTLTSVHTLLPSGTYLQSLTVTNNKITASVISLTIQSFSQFLLNASANKSLSNIEIGTVDKASKIGIQYTMNAQIAGVQTKK